MAGGDSDHAAAVKTRMKPRAGDADRSSHHHPHPATQAWERGAAAPLSLGSSHECQPDSDTELKGSPMACGVAAVPTGPDRHTQLLTCASEFPEDLARRTTARTCLYARLSVSRAVGPTGWRRVITDSRLLQVSHHIFSLFPVGQGPWMSPEAVQWLVGLGLV